MKRAFLCLCFAFAIVVAVATAQETSASKPEVSNPAAGDNSNPFIVACIGDSIVWGGGGATSWPSLLQKELGDGWKVLNFGVNSRTARREGMEFDRRPGNLDYRLTPSYKNSLACHPDLVILMIGTNDSKEPNWDGTGKAFAEGYTSLAEDYLSLRPAPLVAIATSPRVVGGGWTWGVGEEIVGGGIVPFQRAFAEERGLPLFDSRAVLDPHGKSVYGGDGLHPNAEGNALLAAAFAEGARALAPEIAQRRIARVPRFEFGPDGSFTFLHVTDVQDHAKLSPRSAAVLRAALEATHPALVILTGDNVNAGANGASDFAAAMEPLVAIFEEFNVQFCATFGNHDSEKSGEGFLSRQEQYDWLRDRGGSLFVDHDVPALTGVGSGVIELMRHGKSEPAFRLFVMDSGAYCGGGYDGCHTDQIDWYRKVAADGVPHLWFQHIIVPDAADHGLFRAIPEGESGGIQMPVRGAKVRARVAPGVLGSLKEAICPPRWGAYTDNDHVSDGLTLYGAWRSTGGTMRGAYFGHDHMNSFDGVDENGVRIGATKALTVHSYNDGDPGLRLFVVHDDGSFETALATEKHPFPAPASPDAAPWRPAAPQKIPVAEIDESLRDPHPPRASLSPRAPGGTSGFFRPGLLCEGSAQGIFPGPVQALANKNGAMKTQNVATNKTESGSTTSPSIHFASVLPVPTTHRPEVLTEAASLARPWTTGDAYRYRGQVYAKEPGAVRFGERIYDCICVKLGGRTVFETKDWQNPHVSDSIYFPGGWFDLEIDLWNEGGRAGAAWPEYNDNGPPVGPGLGVTEKKDAGTDPNDFFFPLDFGDGTLFRVPVEGAAVRIVALRRPQNGSAAGSHGKTEIDIEIPSPRPVSFRYTIWPQNGAKGILLGEVPAGESGTVTLTVPEQIRPGDNFRVRGDAVVPADAPWQDRIFEWSEPFSDR